MFSYKFTYTNTVASIILFSITFLLTACQNSSNLTSVSREKIKKNIREDVTATMKKDQSPGMAVALVNKDKIVFSQGFGVANIDTQQRGRSGKERHPTS